MFGLFGNSNKKTLTVDIIDAVNIIGVDKAGLSEPYVNIYLE